MAELANLICFTRIFGSLFLAIFAPKTLFSPMFYLFLLISDVFDGYFYRKYTKGTEKDKIHWYNKLPITLDPIADFCLGICGFIAWGRITGKIFPAILTIAIGAFVSIFGNVVLQFVSGLLWTICAMILTYGWFILMMAAQILLWIAVSEAPYTFFGIAGSICLFYLILVVFGNKDRLIRRKGVS